MKPEAVKCWLDFFEPGKLYFHKYSNDIFMFVEYTKENDCVFLTKDEVFVYKFTDLKVITNPCYWWGKHEFI